MAAIIATGPEGAFIQVKAATVLAFRIGGRPGTEAPMTRNMSSTDRIARATIGLALLGVLVTVDGAWRWLGLVGLVPLITAAVGWCPAYTLLHMRTDDTGPRRPA
ncbi:YgaP family membrane protein [Azospirillum sp.]|uniref:YgaP family membrane protein n=1 Tax=Azospirillum sp. TaxID=34012 RepID=UPI003D7317AE